MGSVTAFALGVLIRAPLAEGDLDAVARDRTRHFVRTRDRH
jgi:hypothetical protein